MEHIADLEELLGRALAARVDLLDDRHEFACRLFNGFLEGCTTIAADVYAATLVLYNHAEDPAQGERLAGAALRFYREALPWLQSALIKTRAGNEEQRRGQLAWGVTPARRIRENGVWYAVDLTLNMDSSLYLDTRGLRAWAGATLRGARVLNTFAYTGSLGVAAAAGGAHQVVQTDRNRRFLNLAKDSYALNGLPVRRADFLAGDFWNQMNVLKRQGQLFDCVFVDPPFFSATGRGTVDLVSQSHRVINKVRPLVANNGWLVAINNALFLSGADYLTMLEALCADGYMRIEEIIPVPPDFTGYPQTRAGSPPADPSPFNHPTKIAVLRVQRKDQKPSSPELPIR
jgi:23S rRNA (cytosine1962-C5)-methyltransferase